jgi:hypothetical protein
MEIRAEMKITNVCLIVLACLLTGCGSNTNQEVAPNPPQWYEGGTLHRASLSEWRAADEHNKLATAADISATLLKGKFDNDMGVLRVKAEAMRDCISLSADPDAEDKMGFFVPLNFLGHRPTPAYWQSVLQHNKVHEVAAACSILLHWY